MKSALLFALLACAMGMNLRDTIQLEPEQAPQLVWVSGPGVQVTNLATNVITSAQVIPITNPQWKGVDGAENIWASAAGESGVFLFTQPFEVSSTIADKIKSVTLYVSAGDKFLPYMTGAFFESKLSAIEDQNTSFDITSDVVVGSNTLYLLVLSTNGKPGLAYKIEIKLHL